VWFNRSKYKPKLPDFLALCERNYAQLNRYVSHEAGDGQSTVIQVSEQHSYRLTVIDVARFTTTLQIELVDQHEHYFRPNFVVRLYHDARVAEVLACQQISRFKARYDYPNTDMLQPDEKRQINLLLRDWLKLCAVQGYTNQELVFG